MCAIPEVSWLVVLSDWNLEMFGERERERDSECRAGRRPEEIVVRSKDFVS